MVKQTADRMIDDGCHGENEEECVSWFGHVERMSDERMEKKIYPLAG